jgi:uncharacterized membrane-anchored protein
MVTFLNFAIMLATLAFGAIGWLAPRYTMKTLDLKTAGSALGMSEIRAASGALFIGLAIAAMIINEPLAFAMVGFAYAGAAIGRTTSIVMDKSGQSTSYMFLAIEVVFAAYLIVANHFLIG